MADGLNEAEIKDLEVLGRNPYGLSYNQARLFMARTVETAREKCEIE